MFYVCITIYGRALAAVACFALQSNDVNRCHSSADDALTSPHVRDVQCIGTVFIDDRATVHAKVFQMILLDA